MPSAKVVAIVLNWNRVNDTLQCVHSLWRSDYTNLDVIVVDNGSSIEAYSALQVALPDVTIMRSEINLGFAGGNNLGLRCALENNADYALVINNDTIVDSHMVGQLVAAAEARSDAGLVGPIIYYLDEPAKVWFAGYRFTHGIYLLRRGLHLTLPLKSVEDVDFVSGCGVLIRCTMLKEVGLFSEDYFMYYEDLDLCFRVKEAGFNIISVTEASMWHAVSASTGGADSPMKQYYQVKSSLIFYRQHSRGLMFMLNVILRLGHAGFTLIWAVVRGQLNLVAVSVFLKGLREGWSNSLAK